MVSSGEGERQKRVEQTSLVRADDADASESLDTWEFLDDGFPVRHPKDSEGESDSSDDWESLGNSSDGERD